MKRRNWSSLVALGLRTSCWDDLVLIDTDGNNFYVCWGWLSANLKWARAFWDEMNKRSSLQKWSTSSLLTRHVQIISFLSKASWGSLLSVFWCTLYRTSCSNFICVHVHSWLCLYGRMWIQVISHSHTIPLNIEERSGFLSKSVINADSKWNIYTKTTWLWTIEERL